LTLDSAYSDHKSLFFITSWAARWCGSLRHLSWWLMVPLLYCCGRR